MPISSSLPWYKLVLGKLLQINKGVVFLVIALTVVGFIMQYSAAGGDISPWAGKQMLRFAVALVFMLAIAITPLSFWMRYAYLFYCTAISLLITVDLAGVTGMGAKRWMQIGMLNIQPAELAKLALVLALARYFHRFQQQNAKHLLLLLPPLILTLIPTILILRQPSLGSAAIVVFIGISMCFLAGIRWRYFLLGLGALIVTAPLGWQFLHTYQQQRILTFLNPEADPLGAGYNIIQSIIAIGSGGLFGKGLVQGSQGQLDFLPEKQTDFIFTMLAEELGFVAGMSVLLLFSLLLLYGFAIAARVRSNFGTLLAGGITVMIFIHMTINTAMVMGLLPVVGVPLPFISYGGSMLVTMMAGIGLLLSAYIHRDHRVSSGYNQDI